jgi:3-methyladenine DNA glycosylase AlkD
MGSVNALAGYIEKRLLELADPENAPAMKAYMKDVQPFLGVSSPKRKELFKEVKAQFGTPDASLWKDAVQELWHGPFREHRYLALHLCHGFKKHLSVSNFPLFLQLSEGVDWWDTSDELSNKIISPLYLKHRELGPHILNLRTSASLWQRRISLLAHIGHKQQMRTEFLRETILMLAHEKDFFIRKAIGWILRDYFRTNPDWVNAFVTSHRDVLSPLSIREALKRSAPADLSPSNQFLYC